MMVTIVKISRITKHHEDVLAIERAEPKNESRSTYILPIDGKLKIKFEGVDVSQLIERDTAKKAKTVRYEFGTFYECPRCERPVRYNWDGCPHCLQRLNWNVEQPKLKNPIDIDM